MTRPIGVPEGYRGTVRVQDVMDLLVEIGPGDYDRADLYKLYMERVRAAGRIGGNPHSFGQMLSSLGCQRLIMWRVKS